MTPAPAVEEPSKFPWKSWGPSRSSQGSLKSVKEQFEVQSGDRRGFMLFWSRGTPYPAPQIIDGPYTISMCFFAGGAEKWSDVAIMAETLLPSSHVPPNSHRRERYWRRRGQQNVSIRVSLCLLHTDTAVENQRKADMIQGGKGQVEGGWPAVSQSPPSTVQVLSQPLLC